MAMTMDVLREVLRARTPSERHASWITLKCHLMRWRKALGVLVRPNAIRMSSRHLVASRLPIRLRPVLSAQAPGGLILTYHRVGSPQIDPQRLSVTPAHFADHLALLRRHLHVVSLRELVRRLSAGQTVSRMVAVTFDDGYADTLYAAKPLLAQNDIPATVFVVSDHVDGASEFWWDDLDKLLLQFGTVPHTLRIRVGRRCYSWYLGDDACWDQAAFERHRDWDLTRAFTPTKRHHVYRALSMLLKTVGQRERSAVLEQLRAWAGKDGAARPSHRTLSAGETLALMAGDLIEIGAHSATHPLLSSLPMAQQKLEVERCKERLQALLGRPVTTFAYPYGALSDYQAGTVKAVQAAGFTIACTTMQDVVRPGGDRFQLPRFTVRNWDAEQFNRNLSTWLPELG
jgi:peptidoglycan/xylan/chitin deacetylase (PgdA/CDA1 family)